MAAIFYRFPDQPMCLAGFYAPSNLRQSAIGVPEFKGLGLEVLEIIKEIFQTKQPVIIYPSSGTGAWEAALVNTLSPRDRVLIYDTGNFASTW